MEESTSLLNDIGVLTGTAVAIVVALLVTLYVLRRREGSEPQGRGTISTLKTIGTAKGWATWGLERVASQCDGYVHCNIGQLLTWAEGNLLSGWLLRAGKKAINTQLSKFVRHRQVRKGCERRTEREREC